MKQGACERPAAGNDEVFPVSRPSNQVKLPVAINGTRGIFILDTGATFLTLRNAFAQKAKVQVDDDSVVFELPFSGDWDTLVRLGSRWVWDTDFTSFASLIVTKKLELAAPAGLVDALARLGQHPRQRTAVLGHVDQARAVELGQRLRERPQERGPDQARGPLHERRDVVVGRHGRRP